MHSRPCCIKCHWCQKSSRSPPEGVAVGYETPSSIWLVGMKDNANSVIGDASLGWVVPSWPDTHVQTLGIIWSDIRDPVKSFSAWSREAIRKRPTRNAFVVDFTPAILAAHADFYVCPGRRYHSLYRGLSIGSGAYGKAADRVIPSDIHNDIVSGSNTAIRSSGDVLRRSRIAIADPCVRCDQHITKDDDCFHYASPENI